MQDEKDLKNYIRGNEERETEKKKRNAFNKRAYVMIWTEYG